MTVTNENKTGGLKIKMPKRNYFRKNPIIFLSQKNSLCGRSKKNVLYFAFYTFGPIIIPVSS